MRIYVSSTFTDLKAYREACIRVLRQLGHDVVSMEDYVAESSIPVDKVVADVKTCDLYIVLVAWRYGYVPKKEHVTVSIKGATKGSTSVTEYEYLAARQYGVKRMAFLIQERAPWPPHLMDGFSPTGAQTSDLAKVLAFRDRLQRDQMVAFFEQPADLEARVSAAVASVGLRGQMIKNSARLHRGSFQGIAANKPINDSGLMPLRTLIDSQPAPEVATIDIKTEWWSTRLYLLAVVSDLLTQIRRVVILEDANFVGMTSTVHIRRALRALHPEVDRFEREKIPLPLPAAPGDALSELVSRWQKALGDALGTTRNEQRVQRSVTRLTLADWLGDGLLTSAIRVADPEQVTVIDLLRVLDYPNIYVPLVPEDAPSGQKPKLMSVINKTTLNAQLAHTYIDDLLTGLGLRFRR